VKEPTPEPVKELTPEPVKEPTPEPVKEPTPEPVKEPTPEPVKEPTPEPEEEETPELDEEETPELDEEPTPEPEEDLLASESFSDSEEEPTPESDSEEEPTPVVEEETRAERRARIMAAQRAAMWSDDEDEPEPAQSKEYIPEPLSRALTIDPDIQAVLSEEEFDEYENCVEEEAMPEINLLENGTLETTAEGMKEEFIPPMPVTPPNEEVDMVMERITEVMGEDFDCDSSEAFVDIPIRTSNPPPVYQEGEETREERRARILAAQRAAMWSDDDESESDVFSQTEIYGTANPDTDERIVAIQSRIDQLQALVVPDAMRAIVDGQIVALSAEIAALQ